MEEIQQNGIYVNNEKYVITISVHKVEILGTRHHREYN